MSLFGWTARTTLATDLAAAGAVPNGTPFVVNDVILGESRSVPRVVTTYTRRNEGASARPSPRGQRAAPDPEMEETVCKTAERPSDLAALAHGYNRPLIPRQPVAPGARRRQRGKKESSAGVSAAIDRADCNAERLNSATCISASLAPTYGKPPSSAVQPGPAARFLPKPVTVARSDIMALGRGQKSVGPVPPLPTDQQPQGTLTPRGARRQYPSPGPPLQRPQTAARAQLMQRALQLAEQGAALRGASLPRPLSARTATASDPRNIRKGATPSMANVPSSARTTTVWSDEVSVEPTGVAKHTQHSIQLFETRLARGLITSSRVPS